MCVVLTGNCINGENDWISCQYIFFMTDKDDDEDEDEIEDVDLLMINVTVNCLTVYLIDRGG